LDLFLDLGFGLFKCAASRHHAVDPDVEHQLELVNVAYKIKMEGVFALEKEMSIR